MARIPPNRWHWVEDVNERRVKRLASLGGTLKEPGQDVVDNLMKIGDPVQVRVKILEKLEDQARNQAADARLVRSVLFTEGGGPFLAAKPQLAEAVLLDVYARAGNVQPSELDVRNLARAVFEDVRPVLVQGKIEAVFKDHDITGVDNAEIRQIRRVLDDRRISFDSPTFAEEVFAARATLVKQVRFEDFFDEPRDELGDRLTDARQRAAIDLLERLGIEPDRLDGRPSADTWARVALGLLGGDGQGRDVLALAGFGSVQPSLDGVLLSDLPEFETAEVVGLIPENIRTCGDLYYIHMFDRAGVFDVTHALAVRFFDRMNLGSGETARKLYAWVKRSRDRFPKADRQRMLARIFEGGRDDRSPFKLLMGQMVESLVRFTERRNAGELIFSSERSLDGVSVSTRSTVLRTVENLQRYLSRAGGGMPVFLAAEAGAELIECFDILDSPELKTYFGGDFTEGMWSIIEEIGETLEGGPPPPPDRMRTLAVHGRRIMRFLADHTQNVSALSDTDLEELATHVQNWLAAYRKPTFDEAEWLEDDDEYGDEELAPADEAVQDALAEAEEADVLNA